VIFDYQPDSAFGEAYLAWQVEPGASARGSPRDVIEELGERFLVVILTHDLEGGEGQGERRFVGPPHLVKHASDVMWSRGRGSER